MDDPFEVLRATPPIPRRLVMEAPAETAETPETPAAGSAPAAARAPAPPAEIGTEARKLLDGCGVLGYLAKKARDTSYLDHTERTTLLCTLGHLGAEGKAALHAIIGHTYNYSSEVTDRHVGRLPEFPIELQTSLGLLRRLPAEAASESGEEPLRSRFVIEV